MHERAHFIAKSFAYMHERAYVCIVHKDMHGEVKETSLNNNKKNP